MVRGDRSYIPVLSALSQLFFFFSPLCFPLEHLFLFALHLRRFGGLSVNMRVLHGDNVPCEDHGVTLSVTYQGVWAES